MSDLFIEQNFVGGLNSKLTHGFKHVEIIFLSPPYDLGPLGQMFGASRGMGGYGNGYSYHYGGW